MFGIDDLAAATIGASVIGGIGNLLGQSSANSTNIQLAEDARNWQTAENKKSRDWQEMMWNKQNEYNTPANQRKLFEEAGYNPYLLGRENLGSGAGAAGTPSMTGAPSVAHVNPINPLSGVSSIMEALSLTQNQQRVDSDVSLQKSQILKNLSSMLIQSYKETGPNGFKQMWDKLEPSFSSLDFFNSPAYMQTMEELDKIRIENDTNSLKKSLLDKFGEKEYVKKFEQIDQLVSESAAKIQLMATEGHVNEGTVWKMGYEVGKLLAESNFLGAQATQISTLLPYMATKLSNEAIGSGYMKDIARYQSNMVGMDFFTKEAEFASNKKVRELLHGDAFQNIQSWNKAMDSNFNPVFTFMKGVGSSLGSVVNPMKFTPLMEMPRNNSYFFNIGQ